MFLFWCHIYIVSQLISNDQNAAIVHTGNIHGLCYSFSPACIAWIALTIPGTRHRSSDDAVLQLLLLLWEIDRVARRRNAQSCIFTGERLWNVNIQRSYVRRPSIIIFKSSGESASVLQWIEGITFLLSASLRFPANCGATGGSAINFWVLSNTLLTE